jgi:hypothetical protein
VRRPCAQTPMELQPAGLTENIGINRVDGPQVPGVRATDRALDDPPLRAEMARSHMRD